MIVSECAGENCTHPECVARRHPTPGESIREKRLAAVPEEKRTTMNRAQRRAAMKGK